MTSNTVHPLMVLVFLALLLASCHTEKFIYCGHDDGFLVVKKHKWQKRPARLIEPNFIYNFYGPTADSNNFKPGDRIRVSLRTGAIENLSQTK